MAQLESTLRNVYSRQHQLLAVPEDFPKKFPSIEFAAE